MCWLKWHPWTKIKMFQPISRGLLVSPFGPCTQLLHSFQSTALHCPMPTSWQQCLPCAHNMAAAVAPCPRCDNSVCCAPTTWRQWLPQALNMAAAVSLCPQHGSWGFLVPTTWWQWLPHTHNMVAVAAPGSSWLLMSSSGTLEDSLVSTQPSQKLSPPADKRWDDCISSRPECTWAHSSFWGMALTAECSWTASFRTQLSRISGRQCAGWVALCQRLTVQGIWKRSWSYPLSPTVVMEWMDSW